MRKFLRSGDVVVTVVILIIALILAVKPSFFTASYAVIYVDGKEYGRYSLVNNNSQTIVITTDFGQNTVIIDSGAAYVVKSSCKDKVEINAGAINKVGQSLVCLPNRVVVTIEGGNNTDATTF